ncbi:MAG: hypothetical protein DRZ76_00890 [Candidatus Nealsonbacteria bacterium]|nr:MAG: hypothetical protein DRZ76_00890 [Candidatus Nealsonbacteria bacterium]
MGDKDFLVLDIGTEAVKAGFSGKTVFRYYDRFGVFDSRDFERDVVGKALFGAIKDLKAERKPSLLALPPNVLRARISSYSLEIKNFRGDIEREILKHNQKEVSKAFFRESGILPQELEFLGQLFLEQKIDGYRVPFFKGYEGRKAEAVILSVFSAKEDLNKYRTIFRKLGVKILKIVHPAQSLTAVFDKRDGVFLDVGGELTQIFVVKGGELQEIFDFPMGGRDFSKALSETLGLSEERARILKERYSLGAMEESSRTKMNEIFADVAQEWYDNLRSKLSNFKGLLPQKFFPFGGASQLPEISEVLEEEYSLEILKNPQEINLILLSNAQKEH